MNAYPASPERPTVLIVDDMPINIQVLANLLSSDYQIKVANSGAKALEIVQLTPPDLILLDVLMPGMDGYQVLQQLKANPNYRDIPVIFITAANDEQSESHGLQLGAVDYIDKPFNPTITKQRIQNQLALRMAQQQVQRFFSLALDLFCILDAGLSFVKINDSWHHALGYELTALEGRGFLTLVHEQDRPATERMIQSLAGSACVAGFVNRLRRQDGEYRHFEWQACAAQNIIYATARDITEKLNAEQRMRLMQRVFDSSREGIVITDLQGRIVDVNDGFVKITGYSREDALNKNPNMLRSGRHDRAFFADLWQNIFDNGFWSGEIWNRSKQGKDYAVWMTITAVTDQYARPDHFVGIFSDITVLKQYEERLEKIAHYDALTGIPNRVLLADRMLHNLAQNKRDQSLMAVCYLDLDGFKPINDQLGHQAGDQVLIEVARRISHVIREGDTVARLGGDEFVILLRQLAREEECAKTLQRVLETIAAPMQIEQNTCSVTASIGVALDFCGETEADQLLRQADQAMYRAKQAGKNNFVFYWDAPQI